MAEHFMGLIQILEQIDQFNLKPEAANGLIKGSDTLIKISEASPKTLFRCCDDHLHHDQPRPTQGSCGESVPDPGDAPHQHHEQHHPRH